MTIRIDGDDSISPGLVLSRELKRSIRIVLRSVFVQNHGVTTKSHTGGGQRPGHGSGNARQEGFNQHDGFCKSNNIKIAIFTMNDGSQTQ